MDCGLGIKYGQGIKRGLEKMDCGVQQANLQFSERVCGLLQFRLHRGSHSVTPGLVFAILNTRRFGQYKTWTADWV